MNGNVENHPVFAALSPLARTIVARNWAATRPQCPRCGSPLAPAASLCTHPFHTAEGAQ